MPKRDEPREASAVARRIREELHDRGYTIRFSSERVDDDNMLARIELVNNETREAYAKIVAIGKIMNMDMAMGLHVSEDLMSDLLTKALAFVNGLRLMIPRPRGSEVEVRLEGERGS